MDSSTLPRIRLSREPSLVPRFYGSLIFAAPTGCVAAIFAGSMLFGFRPTSLHDLACVAILGAVFVLSGFSAIKTFGLLRTRLNVNPHGIDLVASRSNVLVPWSDVRSWKTVVSSYGTNARIEVKLRTATYYAGLAEPRLHENLAILKRYCTSSLRNEGQYWTVLVDEPSAEVPVWCYERHPLTEAVPDDALAPPDLSSYVEHEVNPWTTRPLWFLAVLATAVLVIVAAAVPNAAFSRPWLSSFVVPGFLCYFAVMSYEARVFLGEDGLYFGRSRRLGWNEIEEWTIVRRSETTCLSLNSWSLGDSFAQMLRCHLLDAGTYSREDFLRVIEACGTHAIERMTPLKGSWKPSIAPEAPASAAPASRRSTSGKVLGWVLLLVVLAQAAAFHAVVGLKADTAALFLVLSIICAWFGLGRPRPFVDEDAD